MTTHDLFRSVGGIPLALGDGEPAWFFGWVPRPYATRNFLERSTRPLFAEAGAHLAGTGAGKVALPFQAVRNVWGRDLDPGPQQIGDCVSWGYAGCVDLVACLEVAAGEAEQHSWELRTCTEALYALSRVEFGDMDGSDEDGSFGAWAARAVVNGGTLSRARLGEYNPRRAKQWGKTGLPDDLEAEARAHRIRRAALVQSFEEARDAIANGYPVAVCSNQGFELVRDKQGFAKPSGQWFHCMKFIGGRDDARPGLLCMNSWGPTAPSGPKGDIDIPEGSFWVDAATVGTMLQWKDSYALSQFDGYPRRPV